MNIQPHRLKEPKISITEADWKQTERVFGACNCGPSALAVMLGIPAMQATAAIPNYKTRHYTSPTMMKCALAALGVRYHERFRRGYQRSTNNEHVLCEYGLCRIQWCGPWTAPGANPKWAYRQSHWVGSWNCEGITLPLVYDVNAGWRTQPTWEMDVIPRLLKECVPNANGEWYVTHRWELDL